MSTDTTKKSCDYNSYKRTRYFHGMLLTERDFQEEQIYHQEKRRLLNRMLHGWGVVCGLGVKPTKPETSKIVITPGMALDCLGNEIVVCNDFEVDLKKLPDLCPDMSGSGKDPCAEREIGDCKYYIGIKYTEAPTDPVPVYVTGGSCEEKTCEYSRIREGFCIKLFKSPPCHAVLPKDGLFEKIVNCTNNQQPTECVKEVLDDFVSSFCDQPYPCPACCCDGEPYVILGSIDFKPDECVVKTIRQELININDGRRYVRTPMLWDYFFGSFFPQISQFLDNPFFLICRALGAADPSRVDAVGMMASVYNMTTTQAQNKIKSQGLVYNRTVPLTMAAAANLAGRAVAIEKIEPKTRVDLVTDSSGKVLFYIPAEAEEKIDAAGLRKEMEAKIADGLKKMDAVNQKKLDDIKGKLDEANRAIKDLMTKIGK